MSKLSEAIRETFTELDQLPFNSIDSRMRAWHESAAKLEDSCGAKETEIQRLSSANVALADHRREAEAELEALKRVMLDVAKGIRGREFQPRSIAEVVNGFAAKLEDQAGDQSSAEPRLTFADLRVGERFTCVGSAAKRVKIQAMHGTTVTVNNVVYEGHGCHRSGDRSECADNVEVRRAP